VQGDLDRLQAEHALLSSQLKQAEKEARAYKAEAEALRNELAQASQKPAGAALASHPGVQTRRKLEPEMRAAADASSPAVASADHDTRKVRRRSEPDKEQDITDLLQSDDVVQTRPRTMPATTSGQSLPAATGGTSASADHRTDPVEYLSEELVRRFSAKPLFIAAHACTTAHRPPRARCCICSRACPHATCCLWPASIASTGGTYSRLGPALPALLTRSAPRGWAIFPLAQNCERRFAVATQVPAPLALSRKRRLRLHRHRCASNPPPPLWAISR
jgi:hypothetical protein